MVMLNNVRLDHITSFGDAVFAFSITFIAISIQIPALPDNLSELEVVSRMFQLIPQFEIYFTSFVVIGIFWIKYHLIFNKIKDSQSVMLWLNLILLFFVTLISFGTSLRFENQYISTFVLYALILTATSILLSLIWIHATRYNLLIDDNMTQPSEKIIHNSRNYPYSNICQFYWNRIYKFAACTIYVDSNYSITDLF